MEMELHVLSKSYRDEANVIDLDDQLHLQWLASDDLTSHQKKRKKKRENAISRLKLLE